MHLWKSCNFSFQTDRERQKDLVSKKQRNTQRMDSSSMPQPKPIKEPENHHKIPHWIGNLNHKPWRIHNAEKGNLFVYICFPLKQHTLNIASNEIPLLFEIIQSTRYLLANKMPSPRGSPTLDGCKILLKDVSQDRTPLTNITLFNRRLFVKKDPSTPR